MGILEGRKPYRRREFLLYIVRYDSQQSQWDLEKGQVGADGPRWEALREWKRSSHTQ